MKNYENVFWDWNGTLLDDFSAGYEAVKISLNRRNLPIPDPETHAENFGFPVKNYYKFLGFDLEKESYDSLAAEYTRNYLLFERSVRVEAKRTLEKLFLNDVKQYILSACERNLLKEGLEKGGLGTYFKGIVAMDNVIAGGKTEAGKKFLKDNGIAGKSLMVGDTVHDFEVAQELGMDCVLMESGYNSLKRLQDTGAKIIENLWEVVGIVLGEKDKKGVSFMTPERAERRSFDLSEVGRGFTERYHDFYDDVKNTNKTEDW